MGKQINFFIDKETEEKFFVYLNSIALPRWQFYQSAEDAVFKALGVE